MGFSKMHIRHVVATPMLCAQEGGHWLCLMMHVGQVHSTRGGSRHLEMPVQCHVYTAILCSWTKWRVRHPSSPACRWLTAASGGPRNRVALEVVPHSAHS